MRKNIYLLLASTAVLASLQPTDAAFGAVTDWFSDKTEDLGDKLNDAFEGAADWGKEQLDGISGQDVFDSVGTVVGTVVDGVVQLKEDSGISNKDIFDAAGDLIGKVGEVAKAAADKFGLSDIDGEDVYNGLGNVIGHVTNGVVFLSNKTGITGQDIYDASKQVIGTVVDSVQTGVDESG
eukprot:gene15784-22581_t